MVDTDHYQRKILPLCLLGAVPFLSSSDAVHVSVLQLLHSFQTRECRSELSGLTGVFLFQSRFMMLTVALLSNTT